MDDATSVRLEFREDVAVISLARPGNGNALTHELVSALKDALEAVAASDCRAALLRGEGRHLCVGGDIGVFAGLASAPPARRVAELENLLLAAEPMILTLADMPVPLVLLCRGMLAGAGLSLALCADRVIADTSAAFRFSHLEVGVPPDGGLSWLLPNLVGRRAALRLISERAVLAAQDAQRIGIVTDVVECEDLETMGWQIARGFSRMPSAIRSTRMLLRRGDRPALAAHLVAEREAVLDAVARPEFVERTNAFVRRMGGAAQPDQ